MEVHPLLFPNKSILKFQNYEEEVDNNNTNEIFYNPFKENKPFMTRFDCVISLSRMGVIDFQIPPYLAPVSNVELYLRILSNFHRYLEQYHELDDPLDPQLLELVKMNIKFLERLSN